MDFYSTIHFDLEKTCRICLLPNTPMNSINENNLNVMFTSITNIKVDEVVEMPQNLCLECTGKLVVAYNFQNQCIQSNEALLQYFREVKQLHPKSEAFDGPTQTDNDGVFKSDPQGAGDGAVVRKKRPTRRKQTPRLKQYSQEEVARAIEDSKRRFFENATCIKCGFTGSNMRALSVHISHIHKELKERWCPQCNAEFDDLKSHVVCHNKDDLRCQFCAKLFTAKGHLTEHLRSHSGVRPYKCEMCENCFISKRHLKVHIFSTHTDDKPYKCRYCSRRFAQQCSLKNHLKCHENLETFACDSCGGCFEHSKDLDEHVCDRSENVVARPQNFCEKCNKKVRSLESHIEKHHNVSAISKSDQNNLEAKLCTVCGKQFKTNSKLKVHMRVHTGEAPYKCSFCDKRMSTRNQLVVHERTHTGERPHVCNVCGKGFAQSSVLNTHMRLHTGRPEVCKICDQRFCRPSELRLHMRKHTGEKPFICNECNQTFKQRSHLMEHIKTHSNERPYRCTYCDRAFKQNSSLKSHILIHLGRKPYQCNYCPYACRQSYSLTQHMKQHSEEDATKRERDDTYSCVICQQTFTDITLLKSHTVSVHDIPYCVIE